MTEQSESESLRVANTLLQPRGLQVAKLLILEKLWAGYGNICHIEAIPLEPDDAERNEKKQQHFILKHVTPPVSAKHGANDEGHLRKLISYQVEQYFYTHLAPSMPKDIAVAQCFGNIYDAAQAENGTIAILMSDLCEEFPFAAKHVYVEPPVRAAVSWLTGFHGFWWKRNSELRKGHLRLPPLQEARSPVQRTDGIWLNGGYTYLATRQREYANLRDGLDPEWSSALCEPLADSDQSVTQLVAQVLSPSVSSADVSAISRYETLIHGDVKFENCFANATGSQVAFYDFQYVGLGLGVCDLAKLFTCAVPLIQLTERELDTMDGQTLGMERGERCLLEFYRLCIQDSSGNDYPWHELEMHWNTALVDWLRFQASWEFWGNTKWLKGRVRSILANQEWLTWLSNAAAKSV